jgi:hypothetical protein
MNRLSSGFSQVVPNIGFLQIALIAENVLAYDATALLTAALKESI